MRSAWIGERGDTETLPGLTSEFGRQRLSDAQLDAMRFAAVKTAPRQIRQQRDPDALR